MRKGLKRLVVTFIIIALMVTLLMLTIPLAHIAWLVVAAIWLARSAELPPGEQALNGPLCGTKVRSDWKAYPHPGQVVAPPAPQPDGLAHRGCAALPAVTSGFPAGDH